MAAASFVSKAYCFILLATTHSYTVMPSLHADGTLGDRLFVVMSESTGKFPTKSPPIIPPNLIVRAAKSHMMTKVLMLDWFESVVMAPSSPAKQLLFVDSWSSFKDHASIMALVPPGKELKIMNIPDGTTGFCQPLDIFFFGPFKKMMKKIMNHIKCHYSTSIKVYNRDASFKMLSLVYDIFKAPCFQGMLEYPWRAGGYIYAVPAPFLTPVQKCFDPSVRQSTCKAPLCPTPTIPSFIYCPNCNVTYCFKCWYIDFHKC